VATFTELQTEVQGIIIDLPTFVVAQVPKQINRALRKLQRRHNFKVMEALNPAIVTTLGNRGLGAVPSDFKEVRGRPYTQHNSGEKTFLSLVNGRDAVLTEFSANNADDEGAPVVILDAEPDVFNARSFEVYPSPDGNSDYGDGEYRVVIPYWRYLPSLSAGGDANWFTIRADDWLVYQAAGYCFLIDHDPTNATLWFQLAAGEFKDVVSEDKSSRIANVTEFVPHKGAREILRSRPDSGFLTKIR